MSILLSVNPPYAGMLVDGIKTIEWRKHPLPEGTAFIYETKKGGGSGMVIGEVIFHRMVRVSSAIYLSPYEIEKGGVSWEGIRKYVGDKSFFENWTCSYVRYETARPLSDFSKFGFDRSAPLNRPPQSWCYTVEYAVDKNEKQGDFGKMNDELKHCPFCGARENEDDAPVNVNFYADKPDETDIVFYVQCNRCRSTSGFFDTREEAIQAWNRRANDEQIH